jgi:hypothetical protein
VLQLLILLLMLAALAAPVHAVEYRLRVANLYDKSFAAFIDGSIGRGDGELAMPRLEASLDEGAVPWGALLGDRPLNPVSARVPAAFGAVPPEPPSGEPPATNGQWYEMAWSGRAGERTVWAINASRMSYQQVTQVALKGTDGLRYYLPYSVGIVPARYAVARYPLGWLLVQEERGTLWSAGLAKTMRFADGIAAVVATNENPQFSDWVYFLVEHPAEPTIFKAVVAWERRRGADRWDAPGFRDR